MDKETPPEKSSRKESAESSSDTASKSSRSEEISISESKTKVKSDAKGESGNTRRSKGDATRSEESKFIPKFWSRKPSEKDRSPSKPSCSTTTSGTSTFSIWSKRSESKNTPKLSGNEVFTTPKSEGSLKRSTLSKTTSDASAQRSESGTKSGDSRTPINKSGISRSGGYKEPREKGVFRSGGNRAPSTSGNDREGEKRPKWNSSTTAKIPSIANLYRDYPKKGTLIKSSSTKRTEPRGHSTATNFTVAGQNKDAMTRSKGNSAVPCNNNSTKSAKCTASHSASASLEKGSTSVSIEENSTMPRSTSTPLQMSSNMSSETSTEQHSSMASTQTRSSVPPCSITTEEKIATVPTRASLPGAEGIPAALGSLPGAEGIPDEQTSSSITDERLNIMPRRSSLPEKRLYELPRRGSLPEGRIDSLSLRENLLGKKNVVPISHSNTLSDICDIESASGLPPRASSLCSVNNDTGSRVDPLSSESTSREDVLGAAAALGSDCNASASECSPGGGAKPKSKKQVKDAQSELVDRSMSSGTPPGSDELGPIPEYKPMKLVGILGCLETGRNTLACRLTRVTYNEKRFRRNGYNLKVIVIPTHYTDPCDHFDLTSSYLFSLDAIILLFSLDNHATIEKLLHSCVPMVRQVRPQLPPLLLVGNKLDIVRDIQSNTLPAHVRAEFVDSRIVERLMNHLRADRYIECSATTMENVEKIELGLLYLLPDIYPNHTPTPLLDLSKGRSGLCIVGDRGTGKNMLAARLCNKCDLENHPRHVPWKNVMHHGRNSQFQLQVAVVRRDADDPDEEWWMREELLEEMDAVIVLYAINDLESFMKAINELFQEAMYLIKDRRRVFLVANKVDLRRNPQQQALLANDLIDVIADDLRVRTFRCSAYTAEGVDEIQSTFFNDFVDCWC